MKLIVFIAFLASAFPLLAADNSKAETKAGTKYVSF